MLLAVHQLHVEAVPFCWSLTTSAFRFFCIKRNKTESPYGRHLISDEKLGTG